MPFSSLLLENWIILLFFPKCSTLLAHISANHSSKSTYKDSITASSVKSESLFSKPFSPCPCTRFLTSVHVPAGTAHRLPEQSQHPQYRLPKTDCKHILSTTWQSWVKVRSSVVFLFIQGLWEAGLGTYRPAPKQGATREVPGSILPVWDGASPCLCWISSSMLSI